jgi:type IV pilus assembly protein PilA
VAKRINGFTLIELMTVVAIIAILAMLATPSYLDRTLKNQIREALPLAEIAKTPISTAWTTTNTFPEDNAGAGLPAADKIVNNFISSVNVEKGAIHVTFGNRANRLLKGKILTIRPAIAEGEPIVPITWVCGQGAAPAEMAVKGNNKTDIPAAYLPNKCR